MGRFTVRFSCLLAVLLLLTAGCGSGKSGSQPTPTPTPTQIPDFSLGVSTVVLTLTPGTPSTFQVSLTPVNGFSAPVTVQISGLPSGVTLNPGASFSMSALSPQTITVSAAASATPGTYSLQVSASSGTLIHSQAESLTIQAAPQPDFALALSTNSVQVGSGAQGSFQIALTPSGGFSGGVQVQISGLPAGATLIPSGPFVLYAAAPQTVTIATADALIAGSYPLSVAATAGSINHTATETLNIAAFAALPSRADFIRTDDTPGSAVYDQLHQRIFVSNPISGTVDVLSSVTYQLLRHIPVPSPAGMDISPDNSTVFIGTGTQVLYALDTTTMALNSRYVVPLNQLSPSVILTQPPLAPVAAPDGTALISANGGILKWNPTTGQTSTVLTDAPMAFQYGPATGPMGRSAGHLKVILSNNLSTSTVYVYDTSKNTYSAPLTFNGYAPAVAVNPAGTQFAVAWIQSSDSVGYISFFDANLNPVKTIQGSGHLLYSHDGSLLYISGQFGQMPLIEALNTTTFKVTGTAPLYASSIGNRTPPLSVATPLTTDETGRVFGSADHGLSIDDALDLRPYTGAEVYPIYDLFAAPDDGPVGQQQTMQIETESYPSAPGIWFGSLAGNTMLGNGPLTAIAPASSQAGPVNIRFEDADNVQAWIPQGYTYGSALLSGPDIAGPQAGKSTISLWGYGLGNDAGTPGSGSSGVAVNLGGVAATLSSSITYTGSGGYPFPLWDLTVQTPQTALGASDITVTSTWGSSMLPSAYHSLDMPSYALDGTPYALAYDAKRQQVYVAVSDHIDVFSLTSKAFLSTIQVPTLNSVKQLAGLALTPDDSRLLAANYGDASVAVIDPDNPSAAKAVAVGIQPSQSPYAQGPAQLAATNTGLVFLSVGARPYVIPGSAVRTTSERLARATPQASNSPTAEPSVWILDLTSMTASPYAPTANVSSAPYIAASSDGSELCLTGEYLPLSVYQSASATLTQGVYYSRGGSCAVNDTAVFTGASVSNLSLQELSTGSLPDYQQSALGTGGPLNGQTIDPTGALVYVPYLNSIELFDTHTGEHRETISLPNALDQLSAGSLAIDSTGEQLFAVTANGLTVVHLDALPLAVASITASSSSWTITGTGFVAGTTASADGIALSTEFTDANHLQVSTAPGLGAIHTLTLANPDGHTYTYDAAYLR